MFTFSWPLAILNYLSCYCTSLILTSSQFCVFDIPLQAHPQKQRGKSETSSYSMDSSLVKFCLEQCFSLPIREQAKGYLHPPGANGGEGLAMVVWRHCTDVGAHPCHSAYSVQLRPLSTN